MLELTTSLNVRNKISLLRSNENELREGPIKSLIKSIT